MIADTSFLVALHHGGDKYHGAARKVNLYSDRLLAPYAIWVEFCQTVGLRFSPEKAERILRNAAKGPFHVDEILSWGQIAELGPRLRPIAQDLATENIRPLTLYDAIVCKISATFREPILTYDRGIKAAVQKGLFQGARLG